jgi:2-methylfumaryl-CoA isomerase
VLPAWDIACAFQAAFAIVSAAERRRRTGQGAALRMALSDVAFTDAVASRAWPGRRSCWARSRPAIGNHIYGAFGRDFATADGQRIMVAAISAGQWTGLVAACGIGAEIAALEAATGGISRARRIATSARGNRGAG